MARKVGFSVSKEKTFTIGNAADGSAVTPVNLGTPFKAIGIVCKDASNIAASTNLSAEVAYDDGSTFSALYEIDDPATQWSKGSLVTTGKFAFVLTHGFGVQKIRLILSNNASGGTVVFGLFGIEGQV